MSLKTILSSTAVLAGGIALMQEQTYLDNHFTSPIFSPTRSQRIKNKVLRLRKKR